MAIWFYADDSRQQLEVTAEKLHDLAEAGIVRADTLVWREGMPEWVTYASAFGVGSAGSIDLAGPSPAAASLYPGDPENPYAPPAAAPLGKGSGSGALPYRPADGGAIASLVCSIVGLFFCLLVSIAGIVLGHTSLARIQASDGRLGGEKLAIAGLIVGYLALAIALVGIIIVIVLD
ncbi:MAG: DUF4190 domain-containing protein [Verrucomicrobiales bacterium]